MKPPRVWLACIASMLAPACAPSSVAEAETRGDVAWLDRNGTPDAVMALGRLADRDPRAEPLLASRSLYDVQAYKAAWSAVTRNAPWAAPFWREALRDPKRAELAASGMGLREPALAAFVGDLDAALVRIGASPQSVHVATALASAGPAAHAVITERLLDGSTRTAMCRGIASDDGDAQARGALLEVPETARDSPACVDAVIRLAGSSDAALDWLAESGEPGLLGAAGKDEKLSCARLHEAWARAFTRRPAWIYSALTVPLGNAVKRCPAELDGVLADTLTHLPSAHAVVAEAIDPWADYGDALHATCSALTTVGMAKDSPVVRERASDVRVHVCKLPG